MAIQHDLTARNEDLPDERKLQFRIGINLGDVIVDRNEIYGDGVNVAVRLESLAELGGGRNRLPQPVRWGASRRKFWPPRKGCSWRWNDGTISLNLGVIWEMSA